MWTSLKDQDSPTWEKLRRIVRYYYSLKTKIFGLKPQYNMYNDIEIPLLNDRNYVMLTIRENYPEYFTAIDFSSDLLDDFHPLSKNSLAFMRVHLESLRKSDEKKKIVKDFVNKTKKYSQLYVVHD